MRDDRGRIQIILEAIERIGIRGRAAFFEDEMVQVWVVHHLQIIGEAARGVSPEFGSIIQTFPGRILSGCETFWSITILVSIRKRSGGWWSTISPS